MPEVILIQSGDSMFMLKIATDLASKYNIPLLIYNSESYYFKNTSFMGQSFFEKLWYKLYIRLYRKQFEKTINQASLTIYANELLKHDYFQKFRKPSIVLYTSSNLEFKSKIWNNTSPRFAYLGNLGLGRHLSLIEIANALQAINHKYKLEIYGNVPTIEIKTAFKNCSNIEYKGFADYPEVITIMHSVDVLFHTERFSNFTEYDLKYAFSTKIADSLACGTNFLIYAPASLACTKYLSENKCAWVVSNKRMLTSTLKCLIQKDQLRHEILQNAHNITQQNHESKQNNNKFRKIIYLLANPTNT
ncbi:MAG: glycosyltransferase [Muribaculaceae bacterium]